MAQDIAPNLLESIRRDFVRSLGGSKRAAELLEAIQSGQAGYAEAGEYAEEVGRALSEAFQSNLSRDTLPDGRMYWNLANRVIRPLLEEDHALVSEAARQVQQQLNEAAGIGIKAQSVPLDQDRVDGILNRLAAAEQYDSVAWLLDEPVILFSRSVVDESVRRNAEFQGEAGLSPRIIRRAESHCCEWCARLAGTYTYPDVPRDVYRRHDFCRCVVEYDPGDGKRQNVHTKQWTRSSADATMKIQDRLYPINPETGKRYEPHPLQMDDKQVGKKIGKHAQDYGLDPADPQSRELLCAKILRICEQADERCWGEWRGQEWPVLFHIRGSDVVIESKQGKFITILKGGIDNERVKRAREQKL